MGPHGERENIADLSSIRTHDNLIIYLLILRVLHVQMLTRPQEQIAVALPTELQGQMGAGRGIFVKLFNLAHSNKTTIYAYSAEQLPHQLRVHLPLTTILTSFHLSL